jgi:hypothetical protein
MSILSKEKGLYSEELLQDDKSTLTGSYFEAFFDIPVTGDLSEFWDSLNRVEVSYQDHRDYMESNLGIRDIGAMDVPEYAAYTACNGVVGITADIGPVDTCDRSI